jgi:hypothetical protein
MVVADGPGCRAGGAAGPVTRPVLGTIATMRPDPSAVAILATTGALLPAQTVTVAAAALTPLTCAVTVGTQVSSQTVPAGPVANFGFIGVNPATLLGSASLAWTGSATPTLAVMTMTFATHLNGATSARIGPGEFLVTFTGNSPTPMPVRYEAIAAYSGTTAVQIAVDTGNDGTIDWQFGAGPFAGSVANLAAQPLPLRVVFDNQTLAAGSSLVTLSLRVLPDQGIHVVPMPVNCGLFNNPYSVEALFDTTFADLQIRASTTAWHVLGLQAQPLLLPPSLTLTPVPCLVIPRPDVVLRTGTIFLAIPAAVRPIVLYTQLLDFTPGLRVSDAFQVAAF